MRIVFSLLTILLLGNVANAQIKIGIRVAPQLTWPNTDNKTTTSNGTRINASYGLMLDYYLSENYGLGTELCINTYGANLNVKKDKFTAVDYNGTSYPNTDDLKYNYRMQYFQIPLLLKMRTNEIGYIRYYAEFGFSAGFLIHSRADVKLNDFSIDNVNVNNPDPEDKFKIEPNGYSDKVNKFRSSLVIGAGIQYNLHSNTMFVAGIRYDNAFSSFTSDDRWSTSLNYLALNIGILF